MRLTVWKSVLAGTLLVYPVVGAAYVGPGLGVGTIGVILGVIGSILLAVFAVIWYPFKRLMRRRRQKRAMEQADASQASGDVVQASELAKHEDQPEAERQG